MSETRPTPPLSAAGCRVFPKRPRETYRSKSMSQSGISGDSVRLLLEHPSISAIRITLSVLPTQPELASLLSAICESSPSKTYSVSMNWESASVGNSSRFSLELLPDTATSSDSPLPTSIRVEGIGLPDSEQVLLLDTRTGRFYRLSQVGMEAENPAST